MVISCLSGWDLLQCNCFTILLVPWGQELCIIYFSFLSVCHIVLVKCGVMDIIYRVKIISKLYFRMLVEISDVFIQFPSWVLHVCFLHFTDGGCGEWCMLLREVWCLGDPGLLFDMFFSPKNAILSHLQKCIGRVEVLEFWNYNDIL